MAEQIFFFPGKCVSDFILILVLNVEVVGPSFNEHWVLRIQDLESADLFLISSPIKFPFCESKSLILRMVDNLLDIPLRHT